jgi:hypothetical protein
VKGSPASAATGIPVSAASLCGIYLWAGSATIRLQQVKFPDRDVDEDAHHAAHTRTAARQLVDCGLNFAFLAMNWGFAPEFEAPFWHEFQQAVRNFQDEGFRVAGYVQSSNCVAEGSYAARDWFARTPAGRTIPYFRNRLMTCWNHPDWVEEVATHAERVLDAGADGVFFDNLWMGATPWVLGGEAGGFAGCACARCTTALYEATGLRVPRRLEPRSERTRTYLAWRSEVVFQRLKGWAGRVRARNGKAWVLANNCDVMLRDTRALFGIRPARLAPLQDVLLVENVAMPRFEPQRRRLIANALPLKALRAVAPGKPILSITYRHGIGLDGPPEAPAVRRTLAECAALGVAPVMKGSEFLDSNGRFTVITAASLAGARAAMGDMLHWLRRHDSLFIGAQPDPDVLVLYDADAVERDFPRHAHATYGTAMALLGAGVSFAFVTPADLVAEGPPLIVPPGCNTPPAAAARLLAIPPDLLRHDRSAGLARLGAVRWMAAPFLEWLSRLYFGSARVRRAIDASGMTRRFLVSPYFTLPRGVRKLREPLSALRPMAQPHGPVLVERWRHSDGRQLVHLVNYHSRTVRVSLPPAWTDCHLHSPDAGTRFTTAASLQLQQYAILEI